MRNFIKILIFGLFAITTYAQQAIEIDSKSVRLPRYANTSAITAAIPTATQGQMVYNQATASPSFHNGSSWQSFTSTPSAEFRNSIAFMANLNNSNNMQSPFTFTVPNGVTRIWIEGWGGGDSGGILPTPLPLINTIKGGDAGSYLSAVVTVTPLEILTLQIGCGGNGNAISGGTTQILRGNSPAVSFFEVGTSPFTYYLPTDPITGKDGLLAFVQGEKGHQPKESYSQTSSTNFVRTLIDGDGGTAYPAQKGGDGVTITFGLANNTVYSGFGTIGGSGASPGGGGGIGSPTGQSGSGGPGMVILHW